MKGPVYVEETCPGYMVHILSQVNFSKCLYENKVGPFAGAKRACILL